MSDVRVTLGVLDRVFYTEHAEPTFVQMGAGDGEALLLLAERIVDAAEALGEPLLSVEQRQVARRAEALLVCVEDAEDAGFGVEQVMESPWGDRFLRQRDAVVLDLLRYSRFCGAMLAGREGVSAIDEVRATYRRSFLQYWWATALLPDFPGHELVSAERFRAHLHRVETQDVDVFMLLRGGWWRLPPFAPAAVLSTGVEPEEALQGRPRADWSMLPAASVEPLAARLEAGLRRFVHLDFLRAVRPALYQDVLNTYEWERDRALLSGYDALMEAQPWTPSYEAVWRYLQGQVETCAKPCPVLADLPVDGGEQHALDVLEALREVWRVVRAARAYGDGLVVVFQEGE